MKKVPDSWMTGYMELGTKRPEAIRGVSSAGKAKTSPMKGPPW